MLTNRIPLSEYHRRWKRAQALCKDKGVEALVVWGRGGGSIDIADDLIYLANYYPIYPWVADYPGGWSGISHAAVILPAAGEPVLVCDNPNVRRDVIAIKDIRVSEGFMPDKVAETLKDMGLEGARLGLVAGSGMMAGVYRRLLEVTKGVEFVDLDLVIESLRMHKTPIEFEILREAVDVGNAAMEALMKCAAIPGKTEADAVSAAYNIVLSRGGAMIDLPCVSGPNTKLWAYGMAPAWTTRQLKAGEFFACDLVGAGVENYKFDFARSLVVGGKWSREQDEIYDGAVAAVHAGIAACRPGIAAAELHKVVYNDLKARGIYHGYPYDNDTAMHGHSFGLGMEAPWIFPGNDMKIEAGMAIALECMAGRDDVGYVKFEQNVLVHADCTELISTCPVRI